MDSNQWQRIEELFHAASHLPAEDRAMFLNGECSGDEVLLREVESLIASADKGHSFIDQPAITLGLRVLSISQKGSLVGQSIGHYKIIQMLGEGGMGEVYLAEDCTLERRVALKFLAPWLVDDAWAKEQLMKEARAVASLEDPNICAVYGLEEIGDCHFIVMQYIEGETLASLLRKAPLGLDSALDLSEQLVKALSAAHRRGIIHRDIKPQNIVVTADGQAKVLDFGLAKFVQRNQNIGPAARVDQTSHLDFVPGTAAYMSPEQTQGRELNCRTDIFSFGIVFYEMLSGLNPFLRPTREETIAAIRTEEPPSLSDGLPDALVGINSKCLQKTLERRYETAEQLLADLLNLRQSRERATARASRRQHLKRYAAAALVLLVLLLAGAGSAYRRVTRVHTLAVLPIMNKSGDPSKDYLSQGLTRNLFDRFSYLPRLKVRLPTVVSSNQDHRAELVNVGKELKAEAVLSGEIVQQGDLLQLRFRMLNTADGAQLWGRTFDLNASDMFVLQDDIIGGVTSSLGLWLLGRDKKLLTKRQTDNREALNMYMRGRYYWSLKRDRYNIPLAIGFFDQAVKLDPAFAEAYSGLADSYVLMPTGTYGPMPTKDAIDKARWYARQALELDNSLAEAHTSLAIVKLRYDWDWQQSEQEFRQAIAVNPEYPTAHYWYSNLLAMRGRFDESIRESQLARDLDPQSPLSAMNYGRALYYARRFEDAEKHFRKMLEQNPGYPQGLNMMGLVQLQEGQVTEAIKTLEELRATNFLMAAAPLGFAYAKAGRHAEALGILRDLDELSKQTPISPQERAIVYVGLRDFDGAFSMLEESYKDRFAALAYLTTDPLYDDLRGDPRFADLAHRIGLQP